MAKDNTFLISDESINSHGFTARTKGIDTTLFEKNPIMLYMHQRGNVIGRWENLKVKKGKLYADAVFDEDDDQANEIAGKVKRGFLKGASMGIKVLEMSEDEKEVLKCQLLEISIVDLGSNTNALKLYKEDELTLLDFSNTPDNLVTILGLSTGATQNEISTSIATLKLENETYKARIAKIETEQTKEAQNLVNLALERNLIKSNTKNIYLHLFKEDFYKGKEAVLELFPKKQTSLLNLLKNNQETKTTGGKTKKSKSNWDLDDYRKFAPDELASNPELYKQLRNDKFNNN